MTTNPGQRGSGSGRFPPATVPSDHPAARLPRRQLKLLRPGMVVPGVITRLIRGGALVDILLDSGEPAFVPLTEIPAKSMAKVRDLIEKGTLQEVRLMQLDRANGTATASLKGLIEEPDEKQEEPRGVRRPVPAPEPPPVVKQAKPAPMGPPKITASERAKRQQEEILKKLRGG
ncbi:MAG TPA: S1 RNA-binding domain-containing protein [Chloroflexota bacterium]|nr:S1 RNA-binding domain-containing protein [Chloroflexota bacterium]